MMKQDQGLPRVVLFVETSTTFGRRLLTGIGRFLRQNGPWTVYLEPRSMYDTLSDWIADWHGSGILSRLVTPDQIELVRKLKIPFVDLNETVAVPDVPSVVNDNEKIGILAATHFLELGLKHFAFVGYPGFLWSDQRGKAFADELARHGFACSEFDVSNGKADPPSSRIDVGCLQRRQGGELADDRVKGPRRYYWTPWENESQLLVRWLKGLTRPTGLFACNDFRAFAVLDACREAGISVPEHLSVLGVDDEDIVCNLCDPPLSSIIPDADRMGYTAASLLDMMIQGREVPCSQIQIPPLGLVHRTSTEVLASDDPVVAQALAVIRREAVFGLTVSELVRKMCLSRSTLQRRFLNSLGRGMHEVILTTRIAHAKILLAETDWPRSEIARRCGFEDENYFSVSFHAVTGESPRDYRSGNQVRSESTNSGLPFFPLPSFKEKEVS